MLRWLVLVEVAGLAWFVLAAPLFRHLPDRGFGLSKTAGILAIVAFVWLGAGMGAPTLSGGVAIAAVVALAVIALSAACARRARALGGMSWRAFAVPELLFLGVFGFVALLRSASPAALGAEKLMDAALLGTLMRAEALPPPDPWLAGHPVNYYYFGALTWATLAKAARMPAAVAYNLALCTIGAQLAAAAFSIGLALSRRVWASLAGALAFVFGGNLASALQAWGAMAVGYDLRAPTLAIEGAITEFPFFSLTWGDLHPHLMAAPNVLLGAGCLLALRRSRRGGVTRHVLALAAGASGGLAWVTSTWDVPMMVGLGVLVVIGLARDRHCATSSDRWQLALAVGLGTAGMAVCAAPFLWHFESPGVRVSLAPSHSGLGPLVSAQGFVVVLLTAVLVGATRRPRTLLCTADATSASRPWTARARKALPLTLCTAVALAAGLVTRSAGVVLLSAMWSGLALAWWRRPHNGPLLLGLAAATALLIPEILRVVEPYGTPFERLNTVFKLHWHATLIAGPLWAWALGRFAPGGAGRLRRRAMPLVVGVCMAAALVYPVVATAVRARHAERPLTLDAIAYLGSRAPGDAALVNYLNRHVTGQPVIVEASTFQYGYAGRISAYTGLPTLVGWGGHERLWRRSAAWRDEIATREQVVHAIYDGPIDVARSRLRQYRVRYVVVGQAERRQYPQLDPRRFDALGTRVFERLGASLYEIAR